MINRLNAKEMSRDELFRLFKVYKTLNEMMADRGYEIFSKDKTYEKWEEEIKEKDEMKGIFTKIIKNENENEENEPENERNDEKEIKKEHLYFHYIPNAKLNKDCIQSFIELMQTDKVNSGMIITSSKLSQQAKQQIESNKELIEIFNLSELVVNITKHELVPKHTLLSKKDRKNLLDRYKIRDSQLPKILISDPVAKYLGLKRGDVVKITRESETAGRYITYRIAS